MDLEQWKAECGARVPASQACNLMAGQSFYLDALEDETERRQAKEFVRSHGRTCARSLRKHIRSRLTVPCACM